MMVFVAKVGVCCLFIGMGTAGFGLLFFPRPTIRILGRVKLTGPYYDAEFDRSSLPIWAWRAMGGAWLFFFLVWGIPAVSLALQR